MAEGAEWLVNKPVLLSTRTLYEAGVRFAGAVEGGQGIRRIQQCAQSREENEISEVLDGAAEAER